MRRGFFPATAAKPITRPAEQQPTAAAAAAAAPPLAPPPTLSAEAFQQSWQQCLQLLRSDSDEKKFVGLLIVPKLLHQGGGKVIKEAVDAVGSQFLERLMLPLTRLCEQQKQQKQQKQQQDQRVEGHQHHAASEQDALQCCLALSVLGAACQAPEIASSGAFRSLLPQMMMVVGAGGAGRALAGPTASTAAATQTEAGPADPSAAIAAANGDSFADALQCALAACSAAPGAGDAEPVRQASESADGVAASAAALQRLLQGSGGGGAREVLMAIRLMGLLLSSTKPELRQHLLERQPERTAEAVVALSEVFGGAAEQLPGGSGGGRDSGDDAGGADAAMCQLEALHTLLLLLPIVDPHSRSAALLRGASTQQQGAGTPALFRAQQQLQRPWQVRIKHGLCGLLSSRVGEVQKRSALQLAAACVQLLGPRWLLPDGTGRSDKEEEREQRRQLHFLKVLMEVLCVEVPLLLSDVMDSEVAVLDQRGRTQPRDNTAKAAAAEGEVAESSQQRDTDDEDMEDSEQQDHQQQQHQQQHKQHEPVDALTVTPASGGSHSSTGNAPQNHPIQAAGQRAFEQLPACYMLLEALVEAVSQESARMERLADLDAHDYDGDGNALTLPTIDEEAAEQLVRRLVETAKVFLDFLSYMEEHHESSSVKDPLVLGAVRVLGRFFAEVPDAHSEAAMKLLPFMLQVRCTDVSSPSSRNGSQALEAVPAAAATAAAATAGSSAMCGAAFLLPALLQWTGGASENSLAWREHICHFKPALTALVCHAADLAAVATAAATQIQASTTAGGSAVLDDVMSLEGALSDTCQVLLNVLDSDISMLAAVAASAAKGTSSSTDGGGGGSTGGSKSRTSANGNGSASASGSMEGQEAPVLGQFTRMAIPLLAPLSNWAATRQQTVTAAAAAPAAKPVPATACESAGRAGVLAAALLAVGARPEVVLSCGALLSLVLGAAAEQLASTWRRQQQPQQQQQQQQSLALDSAWGPGSAVPCELVATSCEAIAWALEVGWACHLLDVAQQQGVDAPPGTRQEGALWWEEEAASQLWAWCLRLSVRVVDNVPVLAALLRPATWVQQASKAAAAVAGSSAAVSEAVVQSVELQLLLKGL